MWENYGRFVHIFSRKKNQKIFQLKARQKNKFLCTLWHRYFYFVLYFTIFCFLIYFILFSYDFEVVNQIIRRKLRSRMYHAWGACLRRRLISQAFKCYSYIEDVWSWKVVTYRLIAFFAYLINAKPSGAMLPRWE